jgi:TPR repeat protein
MALCYKDGQGVGKDHREAAKWFRKAADRGFAEAQCWLGFCYEGGQGVTADAVEAAKWYHKAAEQGQVTAQHNLGLCYANGRGVAKDEAEAVKWFRKAAEQNRAEAQFTLGACYGSGRGVKKDDAEAAQWLRRAAEQNLAEAQFVLGVCHATGKGVSKDEVAATEWYRKAAEQNHAQAEFELGICYGNGLGVAKDDVESAKWLRKAAEQGFVKAQGLLGAVCYFGTGVSKNYVEAYKWTALSMAQGDESARGRLTSLEPLMTREQIAEGQNQASKFKPRVLPPAGADSSAAGIALTRPESSGTAFFITDDGYLVTNEHVAGNGAQVRLVTTSGLISAKVVKVDAANDLALLKASGRFAALPVVPSRSARLGATVGTVGFPNIGLQGFAPKLAKGEIASLSGAGDDARYFQISVPLQPGNSGGALVDERGNVVGVVSAKLNSRAALAASGALPENVNYAVKSSFLLSFLESVPEVFAKLKEPSTQPRPFVDVVKSAERAAVLVLVY